MHFGADTFIVRVPDDAMRPAFREGDYVYVDPDEPIASDEFVWVRVDATTVTVRFYTEEDGIRVLRTFVPDRVECEVDAGNDTMIGGVVVYWGERI